MNLKANEAMISYELAKKLKEVGFPQEERLMYWKVDEMEEPYTVFGTSRYMFSKGKIACAAPTLSEIIEACGESFGKLEHTKALDGKRYWTAFYAVHGASTPDMFYACGFHHLTPEEAVASLWLALNTKK